ncbi:hypothetical protein HDU67_003837 [Dinochytrium kinnereticum]|nr:hypothetical protein HDU67_003837 [Dinochytrium kinnereticum]
MPEVGDETGVKRQSKIRAPLYVCIVSVVVIMTSLIGAIVGYLTLSKSQESINDITSQMRHSILDRTSEAVNNTLIQAQRVLIAKSQNSVLSRFVNNQTAGTQTVWYDYPDILSLHYQMSAQFPTLENTGLLFQQDALGSAAYLAAYPRWGQNAQIYLQDRNTNFTLRGSAILGVDNSYVLSLNTTSSLIRSDWIPNLRFPALASNGIVPGRPFWSGAIYTPVARTFLLPLVWPVWQNLPLGVVGTGSYWAAHFAMLSIKSLDDFLQTVTVSPNGVVALIDGNNGLMLASSIPGISQNGTQNSRFLATQNPNSLVAAAASFLASNFGNGTIQSIPTAQARYEFSFQALGDDILVNSVWIRDEAAGLKWLLVLVIPSNDFLSLIKVTTRNTIIFIVCTCVAALIIAMLLSWAITAPLMQLAKTMVDATQFDFSALSSGFLDKRSMVTEIGRLEGVFHEMMIKFAGAIKANKGLTGNSGAASSFKAGDTANGGNVVAGGTNSVR